MADANSGSLMWRLTRMSWRLLVWRTLRSATPSWRAARLVGLSLYGIYGGYHVIMFVRQVMYW